MNAQPSCLEKCPSCHYIRDCPPVSLAALRRGAVGSQEGVSGLSFPALMRRNGPFPWELNEAVRKMDISHNFVKPLLVVGPWGSPPKCSLKVH